MFRSILVNNGERITVHDEWLIVYQDSEEKKIPLEDIQTLVIDNNKINLSVYSLCKMAGYDINVILCDTKHLPCCNVLSSSSYYASFAAVKRQIDMSDDFKDLLWERIVKAKINNQAHVLQNVTGNIATSTRLQEMAEEVLPGDPGNREAVAAKMFFRNIFGADFTRFYDDVMNAAMNYGYAIIRSMVARTLCAHGYNCNFGIHHIGEGNAFNLADDFMEPFRPVVDYWLSGHCDELVDELTTTNKMSLIGLCNTEVYIDKKNMRLYNAIEKCIASFTSAIRMNNPDLLMLPDLEKYGK